MNHLPPKVLTIAGSDSGGGAGVEADLKTFAALGVHGLVALTAITAQNTMEVLGIQEMTPEMVRLQIEAVVQDVGVDMAKSGMLFSSSIIGEVAAEVRRHAIRLVVDPVMVSKSGKALLRPDAVDALVQELLPLAEVVTPNLDEAERLSGLAIRSVEDSKKAGGRILELGPEAVVVKGGHLPGDPVDVLCRKGLPAVEYRSPRMDDNATTHGTGCTFSAALASFLAMGFGVEESVKKAKDFVRLAIAHGLRIGKGVGPVEPVGALRLDAERFRVLEMMREGISVLESSDSFPVLSPECQINLVMALPLPYATGPNAVCGIPGRIRNLGQQLRASSCPTFGASRHVASAVLAVMEFDPLVRSSMNIRCSREIIDICKNLGFSIGSYDRSLEPEELKKREGATIPWGIAEAVRGLGFVPDIVYHAGDWGKEPMISIFGKDPLEVVGKARRIAEVLVSESESESESKSKSRSRSQ